MSPNRWLRSVLDPCVDLVDIDIGAPEPTDIYTTPAQLTDGLLTLSLMPRSRWQTLLNLETIKVS